MTGPNLRDAASDQRVKVDDGGPIQSRPARRRRGWSVLVALIGLLIFGLALFLQNGPNPEDSGPSTDAIARAIEIANSSIKARNTYDAEALMAMVADEGVSVVLMFDNNMSTAMPSEFLSRRQMGFALEAEEIYGVKYNQAHCGHPKGPPSTATVIEVRCVYKLDSKMRRVAHLSPLRSSFDMMIEDEKIVPSGSHGSTSPSVPVACIQPT